MEQSKHHTIVMTSDGQFHRAERLKNAEIGMEVQFTAIAEKRYFFTKLVRDHRMKMAVAALVFLVAVMPVFSWYGSNQAYAYVNLDINPSVQMELNDNMEVISIQPQNEDAEKLLTFIEDWKKKDASEVTLQLIQISQEEGYVNENNEVLIGVSYIKSDRTDDYSNQLESYLTSEAMNLSVAAFDIPDQIRKQAEESGTSANQLFAEKLKETDAPEQRSTEEHDKAIIQSFYEEDSSENVAGDLSPPPEEKMNQNIVEEPLRPANKGPSQGNAQKPSHAVDQGKKKKDPQNKKEKEHHPKEKQGQSKGKSVERKKEHPHRGHDDKDPHSKGDRDNHDNGRKKGWEKDRDDHPGKRHDKDWKREHKKDQDDDRYKDKKRDRDDDDRDRKHHDKHQDD
ncbi:anti-sigma factor domain-containing protein [Halobacillus litoralis]|uniref:anti-sigma factor domain-containing protein n=1 Tax=Halobacillus litoralis TaxID=45668 RepID=UPI001CD52A6F|nr:anti-sigma factor domain-containing protein [Halobacillus litoralis]MCA0969740.1 anti-sigma factor domain-containing protein [Halobacillus litoralis]